VAINPPSDIVLGVVRAADPARRQAATERLLRLAALPSGAGATTEASAAGEDDSAGPPAGVGIGSWRTATALAPTAQQRPLTPASERRTARDPAFVEFEAMVLQTFVQSLLPKDAVSVFGRGTAGEVWKSMLAEQIACEIARSGGIGIAERTGAGGSPARTAGPFAERLATRAAGALPSRQGQPAAEDNSDFKGTAGAERT
jgi:flagellar protein FlgJ